MANLTQTHRAGISDLQSNLGNIKSDLRAAQASAQALQRDLTAIGTTEALRAANGCMRLKGQMHEALGLILQAHADASDVMLSYDETGGGVVIQGGGGGR